MIELLIHCLQAAAHAGQILFGGWETASVGTVGYLRMRGRVYTLCSRRFRAFDSR